MQSNITEINKCNHQIDFTLTTDELKPHFELAYKKASPNIEIKGFRKGKVPFSLIKKFYGESIELDSIQDIANDCLQSVVKEKNIQLIGQPALINIDYKPNEPLTFSIKYEIRPSIEIKEYKNLDVKKYLHNINDDEVENELKRVLSANAKYEEAQKVLDSNFILTCDMQEFDENNNPIANRKNENVKINLSEPSTEKEIKEVLINAENGKIYNATFDHSHGDHTHKVNLQISVKKIEKIILPELTSDFVKSISKDKFTEIDSFKTSIKTDLENYWTQQYDNRFLEDLINAIVSNHDFDVPDSLVSGIQDGFIEELKSQLGGKQFPKGFDIKKYKDSMKPRAEFQAKWFLIREEIIKIENIEVSDEDIAKTAETESARLGIDKETLINFYKTSDRSKENLLNEKLFALLKESAKISEVNDSEIEKQ